MTEEEATVETIKLFGEDSFTEADEGYGGSFGRSPILRRSLPHRAG